MSNSFTSPPTFTDPQAVVAGQPISSGPVSRIGETINYAFAQGGITNVISQAWREGTCSQSLTTYQSMCEWYLPAASTLHQDLEVYIIAHGTGSIRLTLAMGGTSTQEEVALSGGSAHLYISTLSLASFSATFGTLTMEVKATSGQVKVDSIMARWAPLSSPLHTSTGAVSGLTFRPMGIDRLDTEQPLSARVGHRMLQNIEALRGRYRTWISWSAALNADRDNGADVRPVERLGGGDLQRLIAPTHIPWAETLTQIIYCALRIEGIVTDLEVDIMGQRYTFTINGWNLVTISLDIEPERTSAFKLPIFRVGLDPTEHNLIDTGWNGSTTNPVITALCMWGP